MTFALRTSLGLLIGGLLVPAALAARQFPSFTDIGPTSGVTLLNVSGGASKDFIVESVGNGAGFLDYDNDGDMDLIVVNGSTLDKYPAGGDPMAALYRNDGRTFTDVTWEAGIRTDGWGMGICVADYDNDGYRDFYLTAYGPNVLYRNLGDGTFADVSATAGVADRRWGTNCAFGDYDRDGNLDLYVANYVDFDDTIVPRRGEDEDCRYLGAAIFCGPLGLRGEPDVLFRNGGDGRFADVTSEAGIEDPGYYGFGVVFSDLDNDGWLDIYVANDAVPNLLFHNQRDGTFEEIGLLSGTALDETGQPQSGMGLDSGDYDQDGDIDLFVTNFARDTNTLYENRGGMFFVEATARAQMAETSPRFLGWGTAFVDLDNDGLQDIFVANGHVYPEIAHLNVGQDYAQRKEVYRNLGEGRFDEVALVIGGVLAEGRSARGLAFADIDNDGDRDAVAININDRPSLYRNEGGSRNHWLTMRLEGTRGNRDAIGARIEAEVGGATRVAEVRSGGSFLSHNGMRVHLGLGTATFVDRLRIRWPNGDTEEWTDVEGDRFIAIREGAGITAVGP